MDQDAFNHMSTAIKFSSLLEDKRRILCDFTNLSSFLQKKKEQKNWQSQIVKKQNIKYNIKDQYIYTQCRHIYMYMTHTALSLLNNMSN